MENGVGVVGGAGRIGMPMLYYLLKFDVLVLAVTEIPNLGGGNTIDTLVGSMNSYDKSRGRLPWEASKRGNDIIGIMLNGNNYRIKLITPNEPSDVNWRGLGISIVEECSGKCLTNNPNDLQKAGEYVADVHFQNGAYTVIVSAPTKGEDGTFVHGINEFDYNPERHRFISNGSCTTKAVAIPLAVLYNNGLNTVGNVSISTTHSATGPTLRRLNDPDYSTEEGKIEEAPSGAYSALSRVFNTNGTVRIHGCKAYALRVPTPNGSVALVSVGISDENVTEDDINGMFKKASEDPTYHGSIGFYDGKKEFDSHLLAKLYPVTGNIPSSVISPSKTVKFGTNGIQFVSWYNNELAPPQNQAQFTKYALEKMVSQRAA